MSEHRTKLVLSIVIMMCPHIAGSIAVVFYSSLMFEAIGVSPRRAMYATSGIGATMVALALLSIWLVNRAGRRFLLLLGLTIMCASSIAIVLFNVIEQPGAVIAAVMVFIFGFAIGPGPIPFTVVPELFPPDVKRSAMAICIPFNWLANFSVALAFPHILAQLEDFTFSVFAAGSLGLFVFLYLLLPETRPGPLEGLTFSCQGEACGKACGKACGEACGKAARSSLSIDLHSSTQRGVSRHASVMDQLRHGLSQAAMLTGAGFHGNKTGPHRQDSRERRSKVTGRYTFYDHIRDGGSSLTRTFHRTLSDGAYSQNIIHHIYAGKQSHKISTECFYLSENCEKQRDSGVHYKRLHSEESPDVSRSSVTDKSPPISSATRTVYSPTGVEIGSGNAGLTSLMASYNSSGDCTQSETTGDQRFNTQSPHQQPSVSTEHHVSAGAGDFNESPHNAHSSVEQTRHSAHERVRRSSLRNSTSQSNHDTWTESCDADEEAG
ncbi:hypothetical protein EGW08_021680 [Elysia chlorotica]|uniref:Major facilitator superfamily (MFS) profile domain-containing protein n=1 Tax=Elysia chlorotica TaxID=188477 RepID=A0A433SN09_ELYCH|nr:hypothetical protein EGW08_021680 [Elysia chlorotica]